MDEPFGAVDEITRGMLQDEIRRIHRETGITILFVTHDMREAFKLATQMLVLQEGRVEQYGPPEQVKTQPATDYVRQLIHKQA